jgi:hypothetical protein
MGRKNRLKTRHKHVKPQPKQDEKVQIYYKLEVELVPVPRTPNKRWDAYLASPYTSPIHLGGIERLPDGKYRFWPLMRPGIAFNLEPTTRNDALLRLLYTQLEAKVT